MSAVLEHWNNLPADAAEEEILSCCGSRYWAAQMAAERPFPDEETLFAAASSCWQSLRESDWLEAFQSHPRIGEKHAQAPASASSAAWSQGEQSQMINADSSIQARIALGQRVYEERFGRIFIVCATGKPPAEMLQILEERLSNDPASELVESAAQQEKITQLRLRKWLAGLNRLSTHVLDTALGLPAAGVEVRLQFDGRSLGVHKTDQDGRCANLLPSEAMAPGEYRLQFKTGAYHARHAVAGLYPTVEIAVTVRPGVTHLHVPLLLSPNGYTTYRGS